MTINTDVPMCADCGHFFTDNPEVGRAYAFLYTDSDSFVLGRNGFIGDLVEAVLDMGNDTPDKAAAAVCYALTMGGWPEPEDIVEALLHHSTHGDE